MTKKQTHVQIILKYLQSHKGITSIQAFEKFGITRLSAVIWTLRHKNKLTIESVDRYSVNKYGENVRFVEYRLIK